MVLYPTDRKLLAAMKKAQGNESRCVVMFTNPFCCGSDGWTHADVDAALASSDPVPIGIDKPSYDPALQSLVEKGLVRRNGGSPAYQVTHDGWCNRYLNRYELAKAVLTHFLFPCAVSFVTTLITLFLFV